MREHTWYYERMQHQNAVRLEDTVALEELSIQCKNLDIWQSNGLVRTALLVIVDERRGFLAEGIAVETAGGSGSSHQPLKINHSLVSLSHLMGFIIQQQSAHLPVHWLAHRDGQSRIYTFWRARWQSRGRQKLRQHPKGMCRTAKFHFNSIIAANVARV